MKHNFIIAKEGWVFVLIPAVATVLLLVGNYTVGAVIAFLLALFCAFFFRNPRRIFVEQEGIVLAPADGRVMEVDRVYEDNFMKAECHRVSIFLSIFNVHINRMPIAGEVQWVKKQGGLYLAAYKKEAGEKNVRNYVGLSSAYGPLLVVQVTGMIARRIVCWVKPGDQLVTGQRIGLIRFGSCTELYIPLSTEVLVSAGDIVKGGESIIARFTR